jgi:hypothetical protein
MTINDWPTNDCSVLVPIDTVGCPSVPNLLKVVIRGLPERTGLGETATRSKDSTAAPW